MIQPLNGEGLAAEHIMYNVVATESMKNIERRSANIKILFMT